MLNSSKRLLEALVKGGVVVWMALIFLGCEWGDRSITLIRPDTDNLQVVYTDTATILRSTVMKDSLFTANGNLMAGRFKDDLIGVISARSFFLPFANAGITIPERAVYDSIALASKYVYYYGDTTQRYRISVHHLTQDITTGPFYNQRGASFEAAPLGSASFFPRPRGNDTLRIKLNDALGLTLFNEGAANNIKTQEALIRYFKGLAFVVDDSYQSGFLGFTPERTFVSLYYHVDGPDGKTRMSVDLPIGQFYSQIVNDRAGTAFEGLTDSRDRLLTDLTDGVSVVQSGVGLMTRLDFPFLHQFGADLGKVIVNRAFLRVQLARNPESRGMPPPSSIALYATGANNSWEPTSSPVTDMTGRQMVATFVNDSIHNERYYEFDVSSLMMGLVQEKAPSQFGFLIGPLGRASNQGSPTTTYTSTLDRLILPRGSVKLKIYYTNLVQQQ